MPGKRPRQIQRTTSMSQLGGCGSPFGLRFTPVTTAASAPESFGELDAPITVSKNASCLRGAPPPYRQEAPPFHENMEVFTGVAFSTSEEASAAQNEEDSPQSMAIDSSAEESLYASHTDRIVGYNLVHQTAHLGYTPRFLHDRSMGFQSGFYRGEAVGSVQPAHFLDVCFHCMKRLGQGRDVFIYRGDRAFCSVECRHYQIAADERREKCGMAAVKEGVGVTTPAGDPSNTGQVETAAAA